MSSNAFYNVIEFLLNDSFENVNNLIFTDFSLAPQNLLYEGNHEDREITINYKSNSNEFLSEKKDNLSIIESSNGDNSSNKFYSFDDITEKFQNSDFNEKLKKNSIIEEREQKLCSRKRKRNKTSQGNQDKK